MLFAIFSQSATLWTTWVRHASHVKCIKNRHTANTASVLVVEPPTNKWKVSGSCQSINLVVQGKGGLGPGYMCIPIMSPRIRLASVNCLRVVPSCWYFPCIYFSQSHVQCSISHEMCTCTDNITITDKAQDNNVHISWDIRYAYIHVRL